MIFETSWDDWTPHNIKLSVLLYKYKIPATFYLEIDRTDFVAARILLKSGFEIGSHTFSHPMDLKLLSTEDKTVEIVTSKKAMEDNLDEPVTKFCYPRGRYNEECVKLVKEAEYEEARTTDVFVYSIKEIKDKFRKPTTIHFFNRKEYQGRDLLEIAKEYFDKAFALGDDGYFHLWGHAWEIDRDNNWEKLEEFLKYARSRLQN